jgi:hypothetical protein
VGEMMIFLIACIPELEVLSFSDEHNFSFSSSLFSEPVLARSETALSLDWSMLNTDVLGNPINPIEDVDKLSLLLFANLDHEQVLAGVSNENLRQSDLSGYVEYYPETGETSTTLDMFSLQGVSLDAQENLVDRAGTFMVLASNEKEESLMLSFFLTHVEEENEELYINGESTSLSYVVDLQQQEMIHPEDAQSYVLDWQSVTESGTGTSIQGGQIDSLMLAGFSDSLEELEDSFLQLPDLAEEYYTLDLEYETGVDMEAFVSQGFVDFGTQERWILALRCARCLNPAPLFVGIIENQ